MQNFKRTVRTRGAGDIGSIAIVVVFLTFIYLCIRGAVSTYHDFHDRSKPRVVSAAPKVQPPSAPRVRVRRFVPVKQSSYDGAGMSYAFDTKTGRLCRTWDWMPLTTKGAPDTNRMNGPASVPTCTTLLSDESDPFGLNKSQ